MQRAPPDAPPMYSRVPTLRSSNSLRPAVLMVAFFSAIYGLCAGAAVIRRRNETDTSSKVDTVYLALAVLYFTAAAIEIFGIGAAYKQSIRLVKYYFFGSASVAVIVTAAELTRVIVHFTDKSAIQAACIAGEKADQTGSSATSTDAEITSYCASVWRNASYWDIGLLLFSIFLSFFFASLVASYLHQLLNPQLLRTHTAHVAPSSQYNYPLQPYPPNPYGQPYGAGQGFVPPPYNPAGGPPTYSNESGYDMPKDEKEGANPFADSQGQGMSSEEREQLQHDEEMRRRALNSESTDTVTLEPRRENEGRV
ncbi:hypothetical protein BCR35DRAFT_320752 [Leucosporidium creatinivorum]|uniref:Uncharacterized protein n=1 Tax=Leucosporidium creatinivorum TaxID=106004 RepID=A0A1Y2FZQ0_9BASI|nr:hypothetical protein BCR35DRAFT_320752 [Leucosporidium creatinivorum]